MMVGSVQPIQGLSMQTAGGCSLGNNTKNQVLAISTDSVLAARRSQSALNKALADKLVRVYCIRTQ
jgi:hypothetical protein